MRAFEPSLDEELAGMKQWFAAFCRAFREPEPADQANFDLKELHTNNVCLAARIITAQGGERRRFLAGVAALCHDLGRFEQYRRYRTFRDGDSVNHAHLSAQILSQTTILHALSPAEKESVMCAVRLHNAFTVPAGLAPESEDLLRVVRDADKIDIWRVFIEYFNAPDEEKASAAGLGLPELPFCSPEVVEALAAQRLVPLDLARSLNDYKLLQLSWVYDISFRASFALIRERQIVERLAATLPPDPEVMKAVGSVVSYLDAKLGAGAD